MSTDTRSAAAKLKSEDDQVFESFLPIEKLLEIFQNMSSNSIYQPSELAEYIWFLTRKLLKLDLSQIALIAKQVFTFGKTSMRLLNTTIDNKLIQYDIDCFAHLSSKVVSDNTRTSHPTPLLYACVSYLLGTACYYLQRYGEGLSYLNYAELVCTKSLGDDNRCVKNCVRLVLLATYKQMHYVKVAMGMKVEAVVCARKVLEIMELSVDGDSFELCYAYKYTYEAYIAALDAKEAITFCLKALEVCKRLYGEGSKEVALFRVDLAVLYHVVGECEKAGQEKELWMNTLDCSEFLREEVKGAIMLIRFGMYQKALDLLEVVVARTDIEKRGRIASLNTMAKASCMLGNFDDAANYMKKAAQIIDTNDFDSIFVSNVCLYMSKIYEKMKHLKTALSLSGRAWRTSANREIPTEDKKKHDHQKILLESSTRLFSLISLAHRGKEELQFMKSVVEKLEKLFGPEDIAVGYCCANFGDALMNSGQEDLAVKLIERAMDIVNVTLGPNHLDSLRIRHTLAEVYLKLKRVGKSAEVHNKLMEDLNSLKESERQLFVDKSESLKKRLDAIVAKLKGLIDNKDLSAEKSES